MRHPAPIFVSRTHYDDIAVRARSGDEQAAAWLACIEPVKPIPRDDLRPSWLGPYLQAFDALEPSPVVPIATGYRAPPSPAMLASNPE